MNPALSAVLSKYHVPTTSFEGGIEAHIKQIIDQYGTVKAGVHLFRFTNVTLSAPTSTPETALRTNTSYMADVHCDITELNDGETINETCKYLLFSMPMLLSNWRLPNVFVVSGKLRYIPASTLIRYNFPILIKNKLGSLIEIRSAHPHRPLRSSSTLQVIWGRHKPIFRLSFLKPSLPLALLLACLGCPSLPDVPTDRYQHYWLALHQSFATYTKDSALAALNVAYDKPSDASTALNVIENEIFPHLNSTEHPMQSKCEFLILCFQWCIQLDVGKLAPSVLEELQNIRVHDAGILMASMIRMQLISAFKNAAKNLRRYVRNEQAPILNKLISATQITSKITSALATGTWSNTRKGVSQQVVGTSFIAVLSQIRRISSFVAITDGKHLAARMVNASFFGFICAAQSPEGEACGLVQALASTATITTGGNSSESDLIINVICDESLTGTTTIINCSGHVCATKKSAHDILARFLVRRRQHSIDQFVTFYHSKPMNTIFFSADQGTLFRPLWRNIPSLHKHVEQLSSMMTESVLEELTIDGSLEWVSSDECSSLQIATHLSTRQPSDTHVELSNMAIVGVPALLAPFFMHNQGPRLNYWLNQVKQVIHTHEGHLNGAPNTHNLWYGQKPLVNTVSARALDMADEPTCFNAVFIILPCSDNQEDAILINRAVVDRGALQNSTTRNYDVNIGQHDVIEIPKKNDVGHKHVGYANLNSDGLIKMGTMLKGNDVLVGKTRVIKNINGESVRKCTSTQAVWNDFGTISNIENVNSELVRVQSTYTHRLSVGGTF